MEATARLWRPWTGRRTPLVAGAVVVAAAALTGCGGGAGHVRHGRSGGGGRNEPITVGASSCASGWSAATPGRYAFTVADRSGRTASVALVEFGSGIVVARIPNAAPGSVHPISAHLQSGSVYQWTCQPAGRPLVQSATVQVRPPAGFVDAAPPAPAPVATVQLIAPLSYYRDHTDGLVARVRAQVATLRSRIAAGNLAGARSAWLTAHLTWLSVGQDDGAYGAFGSLGGKIDGTAGGIRGGTASRRFTGFHKVELDLFRRNDLGAAGRDAGVLAGLIGRITPQAVATDYLPATTTSINAWTLRCHEILEDALRDSLTTEDDYGSNSDLADIGADVTATREMLRVLEPLINPRAPRLVTTGRRDLSAVTAALAAVRRPGGWPSLQSLPLRARQRINAAVGAALETLAPVSELMQVGTT